MKDRIVSGGLIIIGLSFAFLGQLYFVYRREYVRDGVFLWTVAAVSLGLFQWRRARRRGGGLGRTRPVWSSKRALRVLGVVGGVALTFIAGLLARNRSETSSFRDLVWLWLIGVTLYLLAFVDVSKIVAAVERLRTGWREHRLQLGALMALLAVALAVRGIGLGHVPVNLGGDEGTQGVAALELIRPPMRNPFATGWFSIPTMSFLAYGLSMRLFGETVAGLRALSALLGTGTVLATFLLARELWGRRVALYASVALAGSHFHVHFSRLGSNQIADGLFATLALWLLVKGLRSRRASAFALSGAVLGIGWYGYFGSRLLGIVVAVFLAWRVMVEHRFIARYGRLLLVLLGAALVVAAPLLLHYAAYPDSLVVRPSQVSIFASGWLMKEQEITGRSSISLLLQQVFKAATAFHYTLDPTFWYHASIPLLDPVSGVLFALGLAWTVARWRWPAGGLVLLWFSLAVLFGWVMTENPPSSMRLLSIAPALAILVGLGLEGLLSWARGILDGQASLRWLRGLALATLVCVAGWNVSYYFLVYTPTRVYGNPTAEIATELGRDLASAADERPVVFYGPPFMYWGFGTLQFLARDVTGIDVPTPGEAEASQIPMGQGVRFVFVPERLSELDAVRAAYPGGTETSTHSEIGARLLYVMYAVPPQ